MSDLNPRMPTGNGVAQRTDSKPAFSHDLFEQMLQPDNLGRAWRQIRANKGQAAMDRHYAEHPKRYVNGPPVVPLPPVRVCINPDDGQTAKQVMADPESFKTAQTPVSLELPEVVT